MKKSLAVTALFAVVALISISCSDSSPSSPSSGYGGYPMPTSSPTSVSTPGGPVTLMVSTGANTYSSTSGTVGAGNVVMLTAHVGDSISLPGSVTHPLYFYDGTTCVYTADTSSHVYSFASTGTYYFHCGNHAATCSAGTCSATNCTQMAGIVTVN